MAGSIRYYGKGKARHNPESAVKRVDGKSQSQNPVKCGHCREFLTVRGRKDRRCTECKHDYTPED